MIQLFSSTLGEEELAAVKRVFESRFLGYGNESKSFEKEFGAKIGSNRVLATNCCTAALYMSMKMLGIGPGDEVIIPSINFVGCGNAIMDAGARPVFADVELDTLNIIPSEISRLRTRNTRAVLLLHYGGHPCNLDEVREHARGLRIIEDSACSVVSTYQGKNCGTLGDIGCFSFDSMKILVMGDGGAIVVKDDELLEKAKQYRYLGMAPKLSSGTDSLAEGKDRWWEIQLATTSNRYTTNDILCSIGRVQLRKLDSFVRRRKAIWRAYQAGLSTIPWLTCPPEPLPQTESSYYLYWLRTDKRDQLAKYLVDNGIYCTFRYYPLHLIPQYGWKEKLPNAEQLDRTALNIPVHQNLTDNDADRVIETIKAFGRRT
ncbi:MAG: DegT/DnrJ/EryC1/StrS family aminotransferase [Chloroflexi bacterium]|nr:DegT/DnrJ/EryC1/StrS family aminotransferase [Chloroflexota bacterium]